jgi:hypothetical protein
VGDLGGSIRSYVYSPRRTEQYFSPGDLLMATREIKTTDADGLARTERKILAFARRERPESLGDLRRGIADQGVIDDRLVNLAILQLLNSHQLDVSFDRRLRIRA